MARKQRLLAGDLGGTKTVIALYESTEQGLSCQREDSFASASYGSLEDVVREFLAGETEKVDAVCFGVAGPVDVEKGRSQITNLPWLIEESGLKQATGAAFVKLLNDLEAAAYGLLQLPDEEFVELNSKAESARDNKAVIAAGTGLGEAILYWDGACYHAIATEGGHCDFAPNNPTEDALLNFLRGQCEGHVSYERILSGPGLFNIYQYLRETGFAPESPSLNAQLKAGDPAQAISQWALEKKDPLCLETLRLFARIYGAEAGNLALKSLARGGVMIAGGIAPKILPVLRNGEFLQGFCDKGRFGSLLERLSVKIALNPKAPLIGAAARARDLLFRG